MLRGAINFAVSTALCYYCFRVGLTEGRSEGFAVGYKHGEVAGRVNQAVEHVYKVVREG